MEKTLLLVLLQMTMVLGGFGSNKVGDDSVGACSGRWNSVDGYVRLSDTKPGLSRRY